MSKNRKNKKEPSAEKFRAGGSSGLKYLSIALIVALLAGLWLYMRWLGNDLEQQASTPNDATRQASTTTSTNVAENAPPDWQRQVNDDQAWLTDADRAEQWKKIDDPTADGWDTEVFTNAVMKQFDGLKKQLTHAGTMSANSLEFMVAADAAIGQMQPAELTPVFDYQGLKVMRGGFSDPPGGSEPSATGPQGLSEVLAELFEKFHDPEKLRLKIKVFRVENLADSVRTHQSLEAFGPTESGLMEINSIWQATWTPDANQPQLRTIRATEFEMVQRTGGAMFSDCTQSLLAKNPSFQQQLLQGYNYWLERSQFQRFLNLLSMPGIAVADVNADGLEDLYVCQEEGLPNLLYLQQPNGTLLDHSAASSADWLQSTRTALFVDLNNDQRLDLVAAIIGGVVIAEGDGTGQFSIRQVLDTDDDIVSLAAADYDLDGKLDIYAGVYYQNDFGGENEAVAIAATEFVYYDANNGGANSLFHNEVSGDQWDFRDVTVESGVDVNNRRYTLASAWEDFDNDGDQDLYVANDFGRNNLFQNQLQPDGTRRFVDIAKAADVEDSASGMATTWGDYDQDGWVDLYVSNMFSYAGNRIMFQDQFKSDVSDDIKQQFQRFARGNTLMRNPGGWNDSGGDDDDSGGEINKFEDTTLQAAVNRGRWAWGSLFVDVNNDSWEDLVVANGYITTEDTGDL